MNDIAASPVIESGDVRVRVIVLTHAGAERLQTTLSALRSTQSKYGPLDIVVIDNGSTDGSGDVARSCGVRVHRLDKNLGFPANNVEMRPSEADIFVLLNDDVTVLPGWLDPLIDALAEGRQRRCGMVQPTLVFETLYAKVSISAERVGDVLAAVVVDGVDVSTSCRPIEGLSQRLGGGDRVERSVLGPAELWVPVAAGVDPVDVTLAFSDFGTVLASARGERVIQNAGIELNTQNYGFDRLEWVPLSDCHNDPADIFGVCGGAMAMTADFVRDVGVFEPSLFLYYEDLDLSWRGRIRGWTYAHVPQSIVLHRHAATVGAQSALHLHWSTRNRLVVLARVAPLGAVMKAWVGEVRGALWHMRHPNGSADHRWREATWRTRALVSAAKAMPTAFQARFRLSRRAPSSGRTHSR